MLHIVLYQPEIPHNTGAIGRLALASAAKLHLIEPLGFDLTAKSVRRAGLDYWQHVNKTVWPSWQAFQEYRQAQSNDLTAKDFLLTTKTKQPYWQADFTATSYLIFGPETRGLPASLLAENQQQNFTIPMVADTTTMHTRSLNLATSVAIVLYEALRQRSL